jgi:Ca-activated chloride channel family protein
MKRCAMIILLFPLVAVAQSDLNNFLYKGNEAYRAGAFPEAEKAYREALKQSPASVAARFNLGNALYRGKKSSEAIPYFDAIVQGNVSDEVRASAYYNKGVLLSQMRKIDESIVAYKQALRLNPADSLARENLQRAMNEKKQQQRSTQPESKKQPSTLNKQQVMQLLNAMQEQEKLLRQRLNQSATPSVNRPEKDW